MDKLLYVISRFWNRFWISIIQFILNKLVWDYTKRNRDLIWDVKDPLRLLKNILGYF